MRDEMRDSARWCAMVRDGSLTLKFLCKPYLEISALRDSPALMGKCFLAS